MNQFVLYFSIFLLIYFLFRSFKGPLHLLFCMGIIGSNFFGSTEKYELQIMPGLTMSLNDFIYLIFILLIIKNTQKIKNIIYTKYLLLIIISFIVITLFRTIIYGNDFILYDLKNYLRNLFPLVIPYFLIIYYSYEKENEFISSLKFLSALSVLVFFLQYLRLYIPEAILLQNQYTGEQKIETLNIYRYNVMGGSLMYLAPSILIYDFLQKKNLSSLIMSVLVLLIFLLSTYRASFIIVFLSFLLIIFQYKKDYKKIFIFIITLIMIMFFFQTLFPQYSLENYWSRIQSSFSEIKNTEGTFLIRWIKTFKIINVFYHNPEVIIMGAYFTVIGKDLFEYISLDLGIIATIALHGLMFTAIIIYLIVRLFKDAVSYEKGIILQSYILVSIPVLLFNFEIFSFFCNHLLVLYGFIITRKKSTSEY